MIFPLLLDIAQTADFIGFSYSAVRHWTYGTKPAPAGWPAPLKVGGKSRRYRRSDLEAWVLDLGSSIQPQQHETSGKRRGRPPLKATGG